MPLTLSLQDRAAGCLLGLACGDAVGTTVEFRAPGSFTPLTDMVGGGPFALPVGKWTDDTSMALCLAESLLHCDGFDARDQMTRYANWWQWGYLSSTGECFDIGNTVRQALAAFLDTGDPWSGPTDPMSAGNGSLMRLAPVVLFHHPDREAVLHFAAESSRTTHAAVEAVDCCRVLADVILRALEGRPKDEVVSPAPPGLTAPRVIDVAAGSFRRRHAAGIRGTGYSVASLEAALWCFDRSDDFEQTVLCAANLGDDADTTAAIAGQIAGAYYGIGGIPARWLDRLHMRAEIEELALGLAAARGNGS